MVYIDEDREYRARAQYQCVTGYEVVSGDEIRMCESNSQWSGSTPTCGMIICIGVSPPTNGIVVQDQPTYDYGSIITFFYNVGYTLVGSRSVTCQANQEWSCDVPVCVVDCGGPCVSATDE